MLPTDEQTAAQLYQAIYEAQTGDVLDLTRSGLDSGYDASPGILPFGSTTSCSEDEEDQQLGRDFQEYILHWRTR